MECTKYTRCTRIVPISAENALLPGALSTAEVHPSPAMPIELPIYDCPIDGLLPMYEQEGLTNTQEILERVMLQDFPTVAALGLPVYAQRLMRVDYTDGTVVFYLDWTPELPGYTVCYLDPWTSTVGPEGMMTNVQYCSGLEAARRAEQIRRCIPPA